MSEMEVVNILNALKESLPCTWQDDMVDKAISHIYEQRATIEALQAKVKELEALLTHQCS